MRHGHKGLGEHFMCRVFTNAVRELWRTFADPFNPYRPELHYMRGPGPKWRAKRAGGVAKAAPVAAKAAPSLRGIAKANA
jgi:hypothetical protein